MATGPVAPTQPSERAPGTASAQGGRLSRLELISVVVTVVMGQHLWWLWLAASVGVLGGLAHEIAQSGTVLFFQRHQDGLYLSALAGMILGAVRRILVVRSHLVFGTSGATATAGTTQISYEVFTAGSALKGVTEAAGGNGVQ